MVLSLRTKIRRQIMGLIFRRYSRNWYNSTSEGKDMGITVFSGTILLHVGEMSMRFSMV
jgi:hypothetical protein